MNEITVEELMNVLLAGITEGKIDGKSTVYIPDLCGIKAANTVLIGKAGNGYRVIITSQK